MFDTKDRAHKRLKIYTLCTLVRRSGFQQNTCYLSTKPHVVISKKDCNLNSAFIPTKNPNFTSLETCNLY